MEEQKIILFLHEIIEKNRKEWKIINWTEKQTNKKKQKSKKSKKRNTIKGTKVIQKKHVHLFF